MVSDVPSHVQKKNAPRRNLLFMWAVGGVVLLLTQAIVRLSAIALEALTSGQMAPWQLGICAIWAVSNCYLEGHRGFHLRFVPRVLARAHYLTQNPEPHLVLLAPLFAMAFFRATRREKAAAWGVTFAVLLAIVAVRQLPQPWRGLIDAGVVTGLTWGTVSMLLGALRRLRGGNPEANPEVPALNSSVQPAAQTAN